LTGTLLDAAWNVIGTVTNIRITLPVSGGTGSCQILDLTLGPLDLDQLGLVVHLDNGSSAPSGPGLRRRTDARARLADSRPPGLGRTPLMADEERQLIEEARKSREETQELREQGRRAGEAEAEPASEQDEPQRPEGPWAKTSSGNADEIA
jgi:hypothetical protein